MKNLPRFLRVTLALFVVLGLLPLQAIAETCQSRPVEVSCCSSIPDHDCRKDGCGCLQPDSGAESTSVALSADQQVSVYAVIEFRADYVYRGVIVGEVLVPDARANGPPGYVPRENASRAPPVNL